MGTLKLSLEDDPAEVNGLGRQLGLEPCNKEPEMLSLDYYSAFKDYAKWVASMRE